MPDIRYELALETKRRTKIPNEVFWGSGITGFDFALADIERRYSDPPGFVRRLGYVPTYNCHGLTFASRRTTVLSEDVRQILPNDGYKQINRSDALAGDVVLYVAGNGDVEHSGIILYREQLLVLVLSKFGNLHEVVHRLDTLPDYSFNSIEFWRMIE